MNYEQIKTQLKHGDCKNIANEVGVSTTYVQNVWREITRGTALSDAVMEATLMTFKARDERKQFLTDFIAAKKIWYKEQEQKYKAEKNTTETNN